jgi:hypothetical protein
MALTSDWVGNLLRFHDGATNIVDVDGANGVLTYYREVKHASQAEQTKSANATLSAADSGMVTYVDTDGVVLTLPSTAAGITYTIVNAGADGAVGISISPAAADKIQGVGLTAADDKDLINTKATAKKGDAVTLVGDGADGWFIQSMHGTWAREA